MAVNIRVCSAILSFSTQINRLRSLQERWPNLLLSSEKHLCMDYMEIMLFSQDMSAVIGGKYVG